MNDTLPITGGPASAVVRQVSALLGTVASPQAEARALVAHVAEVSPSRLLLINIDPADAARLARLVERRLAGEPLQHLIGSAALCTIEVAVGPGVFIPRPETESMVEFALEWLGNQRLESPVVVDLCTGSGAIAKAIAAVVPGARVHAVELSERALAYAERNLRGTGVQLHAEDMSRACSELEGTVDLVISNPPYIPLDAWESVPPEVRDHDPTMALFSGDDGLDAHRVLTGTALRLLRPGGLVVAEHAEVQHEAIERLYLDAGWARVRDHADLTDRWRFISAQRPRTHVA